MDDEQKEGGRNLGSYFPIVKTFDFKDDAVVAVIIGGIVMKEGRYVLSAGVTKKTDEGTFVGKAEIDITPWMLGLWRPILNIKVE